jgi:hypothetical protein
VDHHGEIHVVEVPQPHQLGLTAEELEAPLARLLHAPLYVAVLLGGYREEDHAAGELGEGFPVHEPHGGAEQPRHLGIVTAGVRRARRRIGNRMAGHHQAVELAEQRERGPVGGAPRLRPHPGEREPRLG